MMCKSKKKLEQDICGFSEDCPIKKDNKECPFNQFITMSIDDIVIYINDEKGKQASVLMEHYRQCQHIKKYNRKN